MLPKSRVRDATPALHSTLISGCMCKPSCFCADLELLAEAAPSMRATCAPVRFAPATHLNVATQDDKHHARIN